MNIFNDMCKAISSDTQKMLSSSVIIITILVTIMIIMLIIVIQKCVSFLVRSMVQASNRSGTAVQQGVHKRSCSTWALWRGLGRRSAWKIAQYSNSSPCTSSSGQQTKFCLSFVPIMHSKGSPMIISGLILISTETDRHGLHVAGLWHPQSARAQPGAGRD